MDEQTLSSSSSGYIIIPRLAGSTYKIAIGFPPNAFPEFSVKLVLNEADAGYLLKNDLNRGWYIVDLQTTRSLAIERQPAAVKTVELIKSDDEFAKILSEVVNDSSLRESKISGKAEGITIKSEVNNALNSSTADQAKAVTNNKPRLIKNNKIIISKSNKKNTTAEALITGRESTDTINGLIPVRKTKTVKVKQARNNRFINADSVGLKIDIVATNAKCKKTATQNDFFELRKRMAAAKTEIDMQKIAGSQFASVCFSTAQIKNLGVFFITEEERYKFYVLAYPYVFDSVNFATLQNQLLNSYYINRFKAMLNH